MTCTEDRWVAIGRIGKPKGLSGEVRVRLYARESSILQVGKSFAIGREEEGVNPIAVKDVQVQSSGLFVRFKGVSDRTGAEKLTGQELFARRSEFPNLPKGQYYCCDLIGLHVYDDAGIELGELKEVMSTASNDIYVVVGKVGERLIPAIPGVLKSVDLPSGKMVLSPPEVVDAF